MRSTVASLNRRSYLDQRRDDLTAFARREVARAAVLIARAARTQARSAELCGRQGPVRPARWAADFRLQGWIDGEPVTAEWGPSGLRGSAELLTRADLVVRLGETFRNWSGSALPASLHDGPLRAILTLARACDRVESMVLKPDPAADLLLARRPA